MPRGRRCSRGLKQPPETYPKKRRVGRSLQVSGRQPVWLIRASRKPFTDGQEASVTGKSLPLTDNHYQRWVALVRTQLIKTIYFYALSHCISSLCHKLIFLRTSTKLFSSVSL